MTDRMDAARTACLMQGMSDRLSVDLRALVATGRLTLEERDAMVARCRDCTRADDCILWMVEHARAADAPAYCLNGEELAALRDG
jgi:hypothetical protein